MKRISTILVFTLLMFVAGKTQAQGPGLLINEFDYEMVGIDTAEFIELFNSTANDLELSNYWVILMNGRNDSAYDTIMLPQRLLSPGRFFVICGNAGVIPLCDMVLPIASNIIQNGSPDAIGLWDSTNSVMVDAVSYEGSVNVSQFVEGTGIPNGSSDTSLVADNYMGLSRFPDGHDTQDNSADFHYVCVTPGTANVNTAGGCLSPLLVPTIRSVNNLALFPNPAKEKVSLFGLPSARTDWNVDVYDLTGKVALHSVCKPVNGIINLDIAGLYNGVYMISANNDEHPEFKGKLKLTVYR